MELSKHAKRRAQQRAVAPLLLEWLLQFGRRKRRGAADIVFFDRKARKDLARAVGQQIVDRLAHLLNAYAVVGDDGTVITTGWRTQSLKCN